LKIAFRRTLSRFVGPEIRIGPLTVRKTVV
jgi:hypothetical protein